MEWGYPQMKFADAALLPHKECSRPRWGQRLAFRPVRVRLGITRPRFGKGPPWAASRGMTQTAFDLPILLQQKRAASNSAAAIRRLNVKSFNAQSLGA